MIINKNDLYIAFKKNHESYLRKVHLYLNTQYYNLIFNHDNKMVYDESALCQFKHIENVWIEHEKSDCLNRYDCYKKIQHCLDAERVLKEHPVYHHKIFTYLRYEASLNEIKHFIANDSVLNLEFFDYLAFSIIGVSEQAKLEIISNLWDEAGRGSMQLFHTIKFKKLMDNLGLQYRRESMISNMSWEGIAGINLFSYLSLYSSNRMMYFGLLAATEMLDPPHYTQLLGGFARTSTNDIDIGYYKEHESIDVIHANGWMNKVVLPILNKHPDKIPDFWLGFYLRLDSVQRYYDNLLNAFMTKQAA